MNVLSKIVIPKTNVTMGYINNELEEYAREEFFRLKKVLEIKRKMYGGHEEPKKKKNEDSICLACMEEMEGQKTNVKPKYVPEPEPTLPLSEKENKLKYEDVDKLIKQLNDIVDVTTDMNEKGILQASVDDFLKTAQSLKSKLSEKSEIVEEDKEVIDDQPLSCLVDKIDLDKLCDTCKDIYSKSNEKETQTDLPEDEEVEKEENMDETDEINKEDIRENEPPQYFESNSNLDIIETEFREITKITKIVNPDGKWNVLSKLVIPRVKLSCHYILSELEEIEREDNFRLKRFKELKIKKAKGKEEPTALEEMCSCTHSVQSQNLGNESLDTLFLVSESICSQVCKDYIDEEEQKVSTINKPYTNSICPNCMKSIDQNESKSSIDRFSQKQDKEKEMSLKCTNQKEEQKEVTCPACRKKKSIEFIDQRDMSSQTKMSLNKDDICSYCKRSAPKSEDKVITQVKVKCSSESSLKSDDEKYCPKCKIDNTKAETLNKAENLCSDNRSNPYITNKNICPSCNDTKMKEMLQINENICPSCKVNSKKRLSSKNNLVSCQQVNKCPACSGYDLKQEQYCDHIGALELMDDKFITCQSCKKETKIGKKIEFSDQKNVENKSKNTFTTTRIRNKQQNILNCPSCGKSVAEDDNTINCGNTSDLTSESDNFGNDGSIFEPCSLCEKSKPSNQSHRSIKGTKKKTNNGNGSETTEYYKDIITIKKNSKSDVIHEQITIITKKTHVLPSCSDTEKCLRNNGERPEKIIKITKSESFKPNITNGILKLSSSNTSVPTKAASLSLCLKCMSQKSSKTSSSQRSRSMSRSVSEDLQCNSLHMEDKLKKKLSANNMMNNKESDLNASVTKSCNNCLSNKDKTKSNTTSICKIKIINNEKNSKDNSDEEEIELTPSTIIILKKILSFSSKSAASCSLVEKDKSPANPNMVCVHTKSKPCTQNETKEYPNEENSKLNPLSKTCSLNESQNVSICKSDENVCQTQKYSSCFSNSDENLKKSKTGSSLCTTESKPCKEKSHENIEKSKCCHDRDKAEESENVSSMKEKDQTSKNVCNKSTSYEDKLCQKRPKNDSDMTGVQESCSCSKTKSISNFIENNCTCKRGKPKPSNTSKSDYDCFCSKQASIGKSLSNLYGDIDVCCESSDALSIANQMCSTDNLSGSSCSYLQNLNNPKTESDENIPCSKSNKIGNCNCTSSNVVKREVINKSMCTCSQSKSINKTTDKERKYQCPHTKHSKNNIKSCQSQLFKAKTSCNEKEESKQVYKSKECSCRIDDSAERNETYSHEICNCQTKKVPEVPKSHDRLNNSSDWKRKNSKVIEKTRDMKQECTCSKAKQDIERHQCSCKKGSSKSGLGLQESSQYTKSKYGKCSCQSPDIKIESASDKSNDSFQSLVKTTRCSKSKAKLRKRLQNTKKVIQNGSSIKNTSSSMSEKSNCTCNSKEKENSQQICPKCKQEALKNKSCSCIQTYPKSTKNCKNESTHPPQCSCLSKLSPSNISCQSTESLSIYSQTCSRCASIQTSQKSIRFSEDASSTRTVKSGSSFSTTNSNSTKSCQSCRSKTSQVSCGKKEASTSTKRSDRYDVRTLRHLMENKKPVCPCRSDSAVLKLQKPKNMKPVRKCCSLHGTEYLGS